MQPRVFSLKPKGAWLAILLLAFLPSASSAAGATGLCILVGKNDLRVREAVVMTSSGNPATDEDRRADMIGMQTPVPVAWSSDFWLGIASGDPDEDLLGAPLPDCSDLNRRLCGASSCLQATPKKTPGAQGGH